MAIAERRNIEFGVEGVTLRGWLFVPGAKGPAAAITLAHGYAGVKEHGMERFAQAFAEAGFVVLVHDHRHFGASDGVERGDVDLGSRSPIGGVRFHFLRAGPKLMPLRSASGALSVIGGSDRTVLYFPIFRVPEYSELPVRPASRSR
jgi:uncharacterized protein